MGYKVEAGPERVRHHVPRPHTYKMITRPDQIHRLSDRPLVAEAVAKWVVSCDGWLVRRRENLIMALGYRRVDREQQFLLPPDMREWLPESHLVWFVIETVEELDTSAFCERSVLGGVGRAGFDPQMLVTLLVYGYARGVRSARQIARLCEVDVAFRLICAQDAPEHSTLSRFRAGYEDAFIGLFGQVLGLAARAGLGRFGTVAVDGYKLAADASIDANRDEVWLREQARRMVAEAAAADAVEDAEFGEARGDELPPELSDPATRRAKIRAAVEELESRQRAGEQAEAEADAAAEQRMRRIAAGAKTGPGKARRVDEVAEARLRLARARAAQQAKIDADRARRAAAQERGETPTGRYPRPVEHCVAVRHAEQVLRRAMLRQQTREAVGEQPPKPPLRVNLTDPQSRLMPTRKGWVQGYNVQLGVTGDQLIVATQVSQHTNDSEDFIPMMAAVQQAAELFQAAGREEAVVGVLLADAGYATDTNLTASGPDRLIALGSRRHQHRARSHEPTQGPPPEGATPRQAMRHRLRTPEGVATYKRRGATVEPAIGNLKKIISGLSRRGLQAATAEINLAAAAFNLLKIYRMAAAGG
jgi:transposase